MLNLFLDNDQPLVEWEYLPPIGPRPHKGFVGLKNAGATCYMNSVLQQMFMIEPIRTYLLAAEGAADDFEEEENDKPEAEASQIDTKYIENPHLACYFEILTVAEVEL